MATLHPSNLCLLVYLDETGQEEMKDLQCPIFGMGGCAVLCGTAHRLLDEPWRMMKQDYFGNCEFPFHATSTLGSATAGQRAAVVEYFKSTLISRFAAVIRFNSFLSPTLSPYQIITAVMFNMIGKVANAYPLDSLALIFESSERGDPLVQRWFSTMRADDGHGKPLHVDFAFMDKARRDPGLEVADCIINTAGRHVRHHVRTGQRQPNELYSAVFNSVPRPLVQFIDIEGALINEKK